MTEEALNARRWWTLAVLCLSLLIVFVGNSSLNVAIPTLSRDLDASTSQLQWVVAAYSLVFAGLLFTAGAIGDRFGRKGALQLGLLGFLVAAAAASRATDMWQLIGCRALMGACAAFIMPSTLSILVNVFPPEERTKAIAIWAGVSGSAGAVGQVASGWLLGHFWFGSVFLVNVPFVLAALLLGVALVPRSRDPEEADLDLGGAALSVVGISSLVYGLIEAPDKGWISGTTLGAFALGLVVMTAFVLWERRTDEPMLDMAFFRNPAFSTGTGGMILVFLAMFGVMFLITQYFQLVLGYSPLGAAVRFLPISPIMVIVAPATPRITARIGSNRTVGLGMLLTGAGFAGFWFLTTHTAYAYVLVCIAMLVGGIALSMSPMTAAIMSAVPPRRAGAGSAMNDATRELGSALGVAVLGSIAASRYGSGVAGAIRHLSPADQALARTSLGTALQAAQHLPARLAGPLVSAADRSFVSGIHVAALAGSALCLVAAACVVRYLPHTILQQGAAQAAEDTAVLALAGGEPVHPAERGDAGEPTPELTP
jgi:EmrB/QacA subfamily drug resistance transporter